jgi:hypothetical protein
MIQTEISVHYWAYIIMLTTAPFLIIYCIYSSKYEFIAAITSYSVLAGVKIFRGKQK